MTGGMHSIFRKLIVSYIIVVVIVTCILGVFSYLFFSSRFNKEVEAVHQKALEQVSNTLRFQIMEPVTAGFMELSTEYTNADRIFRFGDRLPGNHYKLYQTYDYLRKIVPKYFGIIDAVHVYYKQQNLLVSSSLGIGYLNDETNYKKPHWIASMNNIPDEFPWIEPKDMILFNGVQKSDGGNAGSFTFVRTYPIISSGSDFQGVFAIDITEKTISDIIQKTVPSDYDNTFVINSRGRIISHPQKNLLYQMLDQEDYIQKILASPKDYDSFIDRIDSVRTMVTFASLPYVDWKIINISPINQFYQSTIFIRQLLVVFCVLAVVTGIFISFLFSKQIYNPLATIIQKLKLLTGPQNAGDPGENEYGLINHFIDGIAAKTRSMAATEPAIRNNFIMGLLYHQYFSAEELQENLTLVDGAMEFPHYNVLLIQLEERAVKNLTLEEIQAIKNDICGEIEKDNGERHRFIGVDLPECKIGVIIGVEEPDAGGVDRLVKGIVSYVRARYAIQVAATIGTWTGSLIDLHQSFKEATLLFRYKYFHPHLTLLEGESFLRKEQSKALLPESILQDFADGLRLRNLEQVQAALRQLTATIGDGDFSATHCEQMLLEQVRTFSVYLKDMRYKITEREISSLENLFSETDNINGFETWLLDFAAKVFRWVETRSSNRNSQIIEQVIKHLSEHLEADLSLDAMARIVNLSPSYFSKIFKDATGRAFTAYVTDLRITKARDLLLQSDLSVQEIGYKVGYNAPAYFIKQFKAKYGYTPYDYRRQNQSRKMDRPG